MFNKALAFGLVLATAACAPPTDPASQAEPASAPSPSVSVARWTPPQPQMMSVGAGALGVETNCLVLLGFGEGPVLLVFPYGQGAWDDAKRVFVWRGAEYRLNDPITVNGGGAAPDSGSLGAGAHDLAGCAVEGRQLFLVS